MSHIRAVYISLLLVLILSLVSCSANTSVLYSGDGSLYAEVDLSADGSPIRVIIFDQNGKKLSTIRPRSSVKDGSDGVEFIDMNFDSHPDLRIATSRGEYVKYDCYIFSPDSDSFVSAPQLNSLLSTSFDSDTKTVKSLYTSHIVEPATDDYPEVYIDEFGSNTYVWSGDNLVLVRRESTTFYSESDIILISVSEPDEDGILEPVDELWLSSEEYEARTGNKFQMPK